MRQPSETRPPEPAEAESEYQAIQREVTEYVDRRLEHLSAKPAFAWTRFDTYFAVCLALILALFGLHFFGRGRPGPPAERPAPARVSEPAPVDAGETRPEPAAAPQAEAKREPARPASAELEEIRRDPQAYWVKLADERPRELGRWLAVVGAGRDLPAGTISEGQKNRFRNLADSDKVPSNALSVARLGLFQYSHARIALREKWPGAGDLKVDLSDDSTRRIQVARLLRALGLEGAFEDPRPEQTAVQVVVVVNAMPRLVD